MSPEISGEWTRKAEADRIAALRALEDTLKRKDQAEIACFHAQQAVEKYLKAIIAHSGRLVPRTHDLRALELLIKGSPLQLSLTDLRRLNQFAVEIRYPGSTATVTEAKQAVSAMRRAVAVCRKRLAGLQRDD